MGNKLAQETCTSDMHPYSFFLYKVHALNITQCYCAQDFTRIKFDATNVRKL